MKTKRNYIEDKIKLSGVKKTFIANKLNLSQSSFSHLLNGDRNLSFEEAKEIAGYLNDSEILLDFLYIEHNISLYPNKLMNENGEVWNVIKSKDKEMLVEFQGKYAIVNNWNPIYCSWATANYFSSKEEAIRNWVEQ